MPTTFTALFHILSLLSLAFLLDVNSLILVTEKQHTSNLRLFLYIPSPILCIILLVKASFMHLRKSFTAISTYSIHVQITLSLSAHLLFNHTIGLPRQ